MSELIYLRDKSRCPQCFVRRNNMDGNCFNCGIRLFPHTNFDFSKLEEETPIRLWWAWSGDREGWKYRDWFMIKRESPNSRELKIDLPDKNYGRSTTPEEVARRGAKITRTVKAN